MIAICVDHDRQALQATGDILKTLPGVTETQLFTHPLAAEEWVKLHRADLAILETDLPEVDGLTLARRLMALDWQTRVIFLTADSGRAVDAFALHVSGYVLKPATPERLAAEVAYAFSGRGVPGTPHIAVQTFGNFDLLVDGETVLFKRSKAKELLAYLVDRQGSSVTRPEAFALLWEEGQYSRPMQKQLDVMIRSLRATLREAGIADIMEMRNGTMRIRPEMLDCDLYRFFEGDPRAVNAYRGEYMSAYSWASLTEAYMDRINKRK